jgi:transcriptional regulator with XRE-family HTH domain
VAAGDLIRELRERLGLRQEDVADRSRGLVSRTTVVYVEGGKSQLKSYGCRKGLADGLGLKLSELEALIASKVTVEELFGRVLERRSKPKGKPATRDVAAG